MNELLEARVGIGPARGRNRPSLPVQSVPLPTYGTLRNFLWTYGFTASAPVQFRGERYASTARAVKRLLPQYTTRTPDVRLHCSGTGSSTGTTVRTGPAPDRRSRVPSNHRIHPASRHLPCQRTPIRIEGNRNEDGLSFTSPLLPKQPFHKACNSP